MNKIILLGRLGADPEMRYTQDGKPVANFSMATNESWKDKDGQKQERTEWHKVVVFGGQAEPCEKYLSKGRQVLVEGKIKTNKWEDDEGNTRYTTQVVANNVQFISGGGDGGGGQNTGGQNQNEFDDGDIPF